MALEEGFPIASGVIEVACRHLINDRIDITGARWSLKGVEAILKLRALNSSGDREHTGLITGSAQSSETTGIC